MYSAGAQTWLTIQCESIPTACAGLFLLVADDRKKMDIAARWPEDSQEPLECLAVCRLAIKQHHSVVTENASSPLRPEGTFDYIAWPIYVDQQLVAVAAVKIVSDGKAKIDTTFKALEIGARWLSLPRDDDEQRQTLFKDAAEVAVNCLSKTSFQSSVVALCHRLVTVFQCERVAVGLYRKGHSQLVALSHSVEQKNKSKLVRVIEAAMDDAVDRDQTLTYPSLDDRVPVRGLSELARRYGNGSVMAVPLVYGGSVFAVVLLERAESLPFSAIDIAKCEQSLALVSGFLQLKLSEEKAISRKLMDSLSENLKSLLGYQHLKTKLVMIAAITLLIFSSVKQTDFTIAADAVLEGSVQRSIAAPLDGYVLSARVRAGDTIEKGLLMAQMDDREIRLEIKRIEGELQQLRREYREAMASGDRVQVRVYDAQIRQVSSRLELENNRLQRTTIEAPFDAFVIDGDLSQSLGAPIERGAVLFKIAPLEGYRVILKINERDITHIRQGQKGKLTLASLPDRRFPLTVEKITQVAKAEGDSNVFRVEASLDDAPSLLRPGMEGVGKVEISRQSIFWVATRRIVDQLRLWTWAYWP